jgi:hypothetical protein
MGEPVVARWERWTDKDTAPVPARVFKPSTKLLIDDFLRERLPSRFKGKPSRRDAVKVRPRLLIRAEIERDAIGYGRRALEVAIHAAVGEAAQSPSPRRKWEPNWLLVARKARRAERGIDHALRALDPNNRKPRFYVQPLGSIAPGPIRAPSAGSRPKPLKPRSARPRKPRRRSGKPASAGPVYADHGMDRPCRADVIARLKVRAHEGELVQVVYLGPREPMRKASAHDLSGPTQLVRCWHDNPFDTVQRSPDPAARILILRPLEIGRSLIRLDGHRNLNSASAIRRSPHAGYKTLLKQVHERSLSAALKALHVNPSSRPPSGLNPTPGALGLRAARG